MQFVYYPTDHLAFSTFGDIARQLRKLLSGGGPKGPPSAPPTIPPIIITPFSYQKPGPAIDPRVPPAGPPLQPPRAPDWRLEAPALH
ncbi:hypothetical protein [Massilia sp. CF038]|uniref:hypothetical protein n=1 Tax=Massilia sp. CF038 TaxID=1881045 RepID=UPI000919D557|nr:hypothetical protein [Massilia sp. CF038]SHH64051.1 hypothetical protein SAMN05428948_4767 [Massilia sp. CF038]